MRTKITINEKTETKSVQKYGVGSILKFSNGRNDIFLGMLCATGMRSIQLICINGNRYNKSHETDGPGGSEFTIGQLEEMFHIEIIAVASTATLDLTF